MFRYRCNSKGYKILHGAVVLQGDGIDYATIREIQVIGNGFSATCVAYGMGGNLLQKVNRDTMSFATKLCYIETQDGQSRDVMKTPKSGTGKTSLPGELFVGREATGKPIMVYAKNEEICLQLENAMRLVIDNGPVADAFDDISTIRARLE